MLKNPLCVFCDVVLCSSVYFCVGILVFFNYNVNEATIKVSGDAVIISYMVRVFVKFDPRALECTHR